MKFNKIKTIFILTFLLSACANFSIDEIEPDSFITDSETKNHLVRFNMNYNYSIPFHNPFYDPISNYWINPEKAFYTYDIEYHKSDSRFFCLYMKTSLISEIQAYLIEKDPARIAYDGAEAKFTSYEKDYIVDGKYLYGYQDINDDYDMNDFGVMVKNKLSNVNYQYEDYTLIQVSQRKEVDFIDNLTTQTKMNRKMYAYVRYPVEYDKDSGNITPSGALNGDPGQRTAEGEFQSSGEFMELRISGEIKASALYYPLPGFSESQKLSDIIIENNTKYVVLPRYDLKKEGDKNIKEFDFLTGDLAQYDSSSIGAEDGIYVGYQKYFLSLLYKDDVKEVYPFSYSAFDFEGVKKLIARKISKDTE